MYRNRRIATNSSTFRDIHWLNFSWCEALIHPWTSLCLFITPTKCGWETCIVHWNRGGKWKYGRRGQGTFLWSSYTLSLLCQVPKKYVTWNRWRVPTCLYHSETSTWTSQISTIALTQTIKTAKRTVTDSPARMAFLSFVGIFYLLLILSDILAVHFNDLSSVFANKINLNFLKSEL